MSVTPYEKTIWKDGDYIEAKRMNTIEDGIYDATDAISNLEGTAYQVAELNQRNSANIIATLKHEHMELNNVQFDFDSTGACTVTGTPTTTTYYEYFRSATSFPTGLQAGKTYQVEFEGTAVLYLYIQFYINNALRNPIVITTSRTITIPATATGCYIALCAANTSERIEITVNPKIWSSVSVATLQGYLDEHTNLLNELRFNQNTLETEVKTTAEGMTQFATHIYRDALIYTAHEDTTVNNEVNFTFEEDGSFNIVGTAESGHARYYFWNRAGLPMGLLEGHTYQIFKNFPEEKIAFQIIIEYKPTTTSTYTEILTVSSGDTVTIPQYSESCAISIYGKRNYSFDEHGLEFRLFDTAQADLVLETLAEQTVNTDKEQSFTEAQKATARANIDAVGQADIAPLLAVTEDVECLKVTDPLKGTYNGLSYEWEGSSTIKLWGTSTSLRRFVIFNGQHAIKTGTSPFAKTLDAGVYQFSFMMSGPALEATSNFPLVYTYTTFENAQTIVSKSIPSAEIEIESEAMVALTLNGPINYGTEEDPTRITVSAKRKTAIDRNVRNDVANLQSVVKPELTAKQKQEIQQLCQDYLDNAARFEYAYGHTSNDWADYTGAGTQASPYKTKALVKIDENNQTIWKVNCNTLVQNIWMGRNVSDYIDKTSDAFSATFSDATNTNTYTPYVNQAFDWGYFCDFPLRELLGNLVPDNSSYYGYVQPEGTDVNSYSINSYYSSTSTNAHHQVFKSFLAANDLARRLWEIGCEIPAADMDIGDLVFTKEFGQVSDTDLQFFYDQACWRNISHVMIVIDKTAKGLPIFLESADSPSTGYIRTLEPLKWTQPSDNAPANIIQGLNWGARMQSICMVARHPAAYGKNNMHKLWKGNDTGSTMPRIPYIATAAKIIADGNTTMNTMRKENYPFPPYL